MRKRKQLGKTLPWIALIMVLFLACFHMDEAFASTMEESVQFMSEAAGRADLQCRIEGNRIVIQGNVTEDRQTLGGSDSWLYLFELQPYEEGIGIRKDYAARIGRESSILISLPLGSKADQDKRYSSFVLAAFDGNIYHTISNRAYVSNPEVLAGNQKPYKEPGSKKGLLLDGDMLSDALELGVRTVSVNMTFNQLIGEGIDYPYGGKIYHFRKEVIQEYDKKISALTDHGISVTAILLNGWNDSLPQLMPPGVSKNDYANYYMFHASTEEGTDALKALASFLATRYSGEDGSKGKISNWIIGNEINDQVWNYIGPKELEAYVREYVKSFRIFYTAIKSVSSSDRLFFSTNFYWNEKNPTNLNYSAKDVIDRFAAISREGGDMDWNLAYHPYAYPLSEPEFWDDREGGYVTDSPDSYIVNFENLRVLTDYFHRSELLTRDKAIRHIILSEQGFTSQSPARGEVQSLQAAALAYAYYIADSNPLIDVMLYHRQVDHPIEANAYAAVGLWKCDMNVSSPFEAVERKMAWHVYKEIDKESSLETTKFAKEILGIEKWSEVISDFKWAEYES